MHTIQRFSKQCFSKTHTHSPLCVLGWSSLRAMAYGITLATLTACGGTGEVSSAASLSSMAASSSSLSSLSLSSSSLSSVTVSSAPLSSSSFSSAAMSSSSVAIASSSAALSSSSASNTMVVLQEADSATCKIEGAIETEHAGYTGAGYANADNAIGAGIVWDVRTTAPGSYQLKIQYANGSTSVRKATLQINDNPSANLNFEGTGAWTQWQEVALNVELTYGTNVIALRGTAVEGLANVDKLTLIGADVTAGNCGVAQIQLPETAFIATALNFQAQAYDKGQNFITAYDWDFGDGSSGSGAKVSHSYVSAGNYPVKLITTDNTGSQHRSQKTLTVLQAVSSVKVYIAGDSTVSTYTDTASPNDQAGWGQMLHEQYSNKVTISNQAVGGRSSRRFIDEGRLEVIWKEIKAGDYFLVQFGTNDGHTTATYTINGATIPYYLDPATDFKTWLQKYVDGAKARGVKLIFVTPPPRNSAYCTGGNGTGAHAQAMRELAAANNVPLVDLNAKSVNYLKSICPSPNPENFFFRRADGSVDGTHFQEHGARVMAGMVADGMAEAGLPISQLRR